MKKVLIFSTAYYPFVGGAEIAIKEITDRLPDFQFDLITARLDRNLPKNERIGKVNLYRVGVGLPLLDKLALPFLGASLAWKLNKKQNYFCFWGVMVSFASGAGYICNLFRSMVGEKKIPIVLTLQEGDSENYLTYKWFGLLNLSWKLALRNTDFLTAISTFLLKRAEKNGYHGKSALIPNGVDPNIFSVSISDITRENLKSSLNKKPGDIFLVTSSRLSHKNAVDDVISALPNLPDNVHFLIIGKGTEGPKLQKQVNTLGLSSRVKFVGFLKQKEIANYFSVSDIFIRPSRSEGFGNSFIEAMAYGLPVIATPVGGIPDFLSDGETGIFCNPDNPQSIVRAVQLLIRDEEQKNKIIEKAKKLVLDEYDWKSVALNMQRKVFDKLP